MGRFLLATGAVLSFGLFGPTASAAETDTCDPIPGIEAIAESDTAKYIVIGDYHGTREIPAFFGDLICHLFAQDRQLAVGLEWPASARGAFTAYLARPDALNRGRLLEALGGGIRDGRGSAAMLALVDRLRPHHAAARLDFVLIQPLPEDSPSAYERRMADLLMQADRDNVDTIIVLVGNVHAMRQPPPPVPGSPGGELTPMAMFLPPAETLTFNVSGYFGASWSCRRGGDGDFDCRSWPLQEGAPGPRGLVRTHEDRFDGRYSVGVPFTASPPAGAPAFPDSRLSERSLPLVMSRQTTPGQPY